MESRAVSAVAAGTGRSFESVYAGGLAQEGRDQTIGIQVDLDQPRAESKVEAVGVDGLWRVDGLVLGGWFHVGQGKAGDGREVEPRRNPGVGVELGAVDPVLAAVVGVVAGGLVVDDGAGAVGQT